MPRQLLSITSWEVCAPPGVGQSRKGSRETELNIRVYDSIPDGKPNRDAQEGVGCWISGIRGHDAQLFTKTYYNQKIRNR